MASDVTALLAAASEFSGLTTDELSDALIVGEAMTNRTAWGDLADRAVILEAAHQLSVNHPGSRPGPEYSPTRYKDERERLLSTLGLSPTVISG